jgi:phosphopantothenoylcysteine decarboxylase/phosphopantothenate--cysteine ligase
MNIVLAVTGSIAAYKAYDLLRLFVKANHKVHVVLSKGAVKLLAPKTFAYLGAIDVWLPEDDFSVEKNKRHFRSPVNHIELSKWCDLMIVAPLGANALAKISLGLADDLLLATYLALPKEKLVLLCPAMNPNMLQHPATTEHLSRITNRPQHYLMSPTKGLLACGDEGLGKLPTVESIFNFALSLPITQTHKFTPKKVLITAGATISPLDPIRYLTNPSTGELGFELCQQFLSQGHNVTCIVGPFSKSKFEDLTSHPNFTLHRIFTAEEMFSIAQDTFPKHDIFISTAAVNDIKFETSSQKLKKEGLNLQLPIKPNPDILGELLKLKKRHQLVIGMAAETEMSVNIIQEKLSRKPVDMLIANHSQGPWAQGGELGFNLSTKGFHQFHLKDLKDGKAIKKGLDVVWAKSKNECAVKILEWCTNHDRRTLSPDQNN